MASIHESDGTTVSVTLRTRFSGELTRVAPGDVDGDGFLEAILADNDRIVGWFDPKFDGCAFEQAAPQDVRALAVDDADGGRDEIAIGGETVTSVLALQ